MSEDEAVALWAVTAAGGFVAPGGDLWDMVTDEVDAVLSRPALECITCSSSGLEPVQAASLVTDDNDSDNDGLDHSSTNTGDGEIIDRVETGAASMPAAAAAAAAGHQGQEMQEQQPTDGVILPPAGDELLFGWCKEVRPLVFATIVLRHVENLASYSSGLLNPPVLAQ